MKKLVNSTLAIFAFSAICLVSCSKDYLETQPSNAVDAQVLFSTTAQTQAALSSLYTSLFSFAEGGGSHDDYGQKSIDIQSDLMGNDMIIHSQGYGWYNSTYQYVAWGRPQSGSQSDVAWNRFYLTIGQANSILDYVDQAKGSQDDRDAIKGQALACRAYCYYELINLYQQTYKGNETKPGVPISLDHGGYKGTRNTVDVVYKQILADLNQAETLLTGKTLGTRGIAMDIHVVQGFKARTALLMEDWANAALNASKAYNYGSTPALMASSDYTKGFSKIDNIEWMWGSQISAAQATIYASFFSHMDPKTSGYASLGQFKKIPKDLYDKIDPADIRKKVFQKPGTGTGASVTGPNASPDYNQLKFKSTSGWAADYVYMRTAEMYLIEAEALARQGNDAAARTSLEKLIKTRFPAYSAGSLSGNALVAEILLQRRIELWGEGFSLMDIKRTKAGLNRPSGASNHGIPNYDPLVFQLPSASSLYIMRIPQRELDANSLLTAADQNP